MCEDIVKIMSRIANNTIGEEVITALTCFRILRRFSNLKAA